MTASSGRLPNLLLVGAMKAGTTTLASVLGEHPSIYICADKEPETLLEPEATQAGSYGALMAQATAAHRYRMEASTAYTKVDHDVAAAARARALLGADVKIIYQIRHPVARAISEFVHLESEIRKAEVEVPMAPVSAQKSYVQNSLYSARIAPWIAQFGATNVHVVRLEDYAADRAGYLAGIARFLALETGFDPAQDETVKNSKSDLKSYRGLGGWVASSRLYRERIKPLIPSAVRARASSALFHHPAITPVVTPADRDALTALLREDALARSYFEQSASQDS